MPILNGKERPDDLRVHVETEMIMKYQVGQVCKKFQLQVYSLDEE
jgi:hypothetical protein